MTITALLHGFGTDTATVENYVTPTPIKDAIANIDLETMLVGYDREMSV